MTAVQKENTWRWGIGLIVSTGLGLMAFQQQVNAVVLRDIRTASETTAVAVQQLSERATRLEVLQDGNRDMIHDLRTRIETLRQSWPTKP